MSPLIDPDWLEAHLHDPNLVVVEVSSQPPQTAEYFRAHIPGARYVYWKDLCWKAWEREFPEPSEMAERLASLGVEDSSLVVLVGDPIQFATYTYWVLAMTGFEHLARVLDGGRAAWLAEGRPITDAIPEVTRGKVDPGPVVNDARVGRDEVLARLRDPNRVLLDLRSREEYVGERVSPITAPFDHGAERAGHIPGAVHLPYDRLLTESSAFRPATELKEEFRRVGALDGREIVTYCRLSHRASLGWFVLTRLLGYPHVKVYDGSWTEWGSMVGMPIVRGEDP